MGVVHIAVRGGRKRCIRGAYVENSGVVLNSNETSFHFLWTSARRHMPGSAPRLDKYERPPHGQLTLEQFALARARRGKGASVSGLTFPPLTKNWTCKSEASWPGAEYTRRTRLKNKLDPSWQLSKAFEEEVKELLGDTFKDWEDSMKPTISSVHRGQPPSESGNRPIQPSYVLRRAEPVDDLGQPLPVDLKSTTMSCQGYISKYRSNETSYTKFGPVPAYLFEDFEGPGFTMDKWFETYGRPTPGSINLGPKQLYTHYQNSSKRCCGERSLQQRMIKGVITN